MGTYLNPGNESFRQIRNKNYVDKTNLINFINDTVETPDKLTCFTRPRRFGKSFAAKMLAAYYDNSCDSRTLFEDLEIGSRESFEKYLNKYDVIYLDITWFISIISSIKDAVKIIQDSVIEELREKYPLYVKEDECILADALISISKQTGNRFVIIIDEWDALFREAKNDDALQKEYVQLLRGLFKGGVSTDQTIAAAYMTGILPIKKYGTQSALTDFREYSMVSPGRLAEYVGFTEPEVKELCKKYDMDFTQMSSWYDGYSFSRIKHVYSPNSVMAAIRDGEIQNYWTMTETFESLKEYISMDFDGLKNSINRMLGGERVSVKIRTFQNDITSFNNKDDVLTLLIHLGYLAYDAEKREAYIPNMEDAEAFEDAVSGEEWGIVGKAISESEELLNATLDKNEEAVAGALELIHESVSSVLNYNNEASLSSAITIAYYTAKRYYDIVRELPAGKGFADLAFIPRKGCDKPAMIVELKYNKDAETAIKQIKEKCYDGKLKEFFGNLIIVGVNYDKTTKKHTCLIEQGYFLI